MAKNVDTTKMKQIVIKYAEKYKVPVDLALALVRQESGFNPNAKSHAGAMGLGQLMPATAKSLGVKNAYDPEQNAEGAMKHLGNLLIHYKGNEELALAAYNAGMGNVQKYGGIPPFKETQNYVRSIKAGKKEYSKIAKNSSLVASNINNVIKGGKNMPLEGQVNMTAMPNYTGNYTRDALIGRAVTGMSSYEIAKDMFRRGQISYEQLNAQFPKQVAQEGITPAMQGASMTPAQRELLDRKVGLTPEQIQQLQAGEQALRQQMIQAQGNYNQGLASQMQAQYDKIMQAAANDPRLQDTGYYIDPERARRDIGYKATDVLLGGSGNIPSYMDMQKMRYQAEVANKYGIPYEQLMAGRQTVYENQLKALGQQAADLKEMANQGQISQRTLMTEMAKIKSASDGLIKGMEKEADYQKEIASKIISAQGDIDKQLYTNAGNADTTGMTQAGGIAQEGIKAQAGNINTQMTGDAQRDVADVGAKANVYRSDTMRAINQENLPWRSNMGYGALFTGLSGVPNSNVGAYMVGTGQMSPTNANASFNYNPIPDAEQRYSLPTNVPFFNNLLNGQSNVDDTYYGDNQ